MSSSIAAFAPAIHPMIKPHHFSSLASSLAAPRAFAPKTLTPSSILSRISVSFDSVPFASAKAVDKIRRTDGDGNLLRVLENEIKCAQEADEQAPLEAELPKDFPFEIIDKTGNDLFILKREFQGEKIEVVVSKFYVGVAVEEETKQDAAEGRNIDGYRQTHISLIVTIDKAGLTLKFWCKLHAEDLKITAITMTMSKDSDEDSDAEGLDFFRHHLFLPKSIDPSRLRLPSISLKSRSIPVNFDYHLFISKRIENRVIAATFFSFSTLFLS